MSEVLPTTIYHYRWKLNKYKKLLESELDPVRKAKLQGSISLLEAKLGPLVIAPPRVVTLKEVEQADTLEQRVIDPTRIKLTKQNAEQVIQARVELFKRKLREGGGEHESE